ncbi:MAG: D-alanine--D-alanine ligase [Candidatus Aminicenantes bacterium]|nr:D-alanine--D-alanine ligase [Candidatus Aminicenantes bacterium]
MKDKKVKVGILFGGMSAEHEVSLKSAAALVKNIDRDKFIPELIYINKEGHWRSIDEDAFNRQDFAAKESHSFIPWLNRPLDKIDVDIYFPILHGPNGEDGKVQGLFEMANAPYVGANSFSSALAMDKGAAKLMFRNAGLKTPDFLVFSENDADEIKEQVSQRLPYPLFVKPNSLGSSVGITKVRKEEELKPALDLAFKYDRRIIIEVGLTAREIEISVMGNEKIMVSPPGELIPGNEFYDYADKYLEGKTTFNIPVKLDEKTGKKVKEMAGKSFRALYLNGMSRIDFFIENKTNEVYINEINTIPGFTEISMFPKLWQVEGITYTGLITRLIKYGFEYHKQFRFSCDWNEKL